MKLRNLRNDHRAEIETWTVGLISILVLIIIAVALLPTIVTQTYAANSSLNAAERTLMGVIPLLIVVALVLVVVFWALSHRRA